jgi:hypothetical protein
MEPNFDPLDFKSFPKIPRFIASYYKYMPWLEGDNIDIYAGYHRGSKGINIFNCDITALSQYITAHYKLGGNIIFDHTKEGGAGILYARLHELANLTNIHCNKFILINALCNNTEIYEEFCKSNNIIDKINVYGLNIIEPKYQLNMQGLSPIDIEFTDIEKKKTYLCFNRMVRPHRLILLSLILKKGLLDAGFYSYFPEAVFEGSPPIDFIFQTASTSLKKEVLAELKDIYSQNEHLMPLVLNINKDHNKNYVDKSDYNYFQNSLFSLVTETFFFENKINNFMGKYNFEEGKGVYFSEKTFKPIIMGHPFILVARPKSLYYLKKLGYQTFSPYINEHYDDIENNGDRLLAIVEEVNRIHNLTNDEKVNWLKNVMPIAIHNREVLRNKTNFLLD